uniref:Uncharacterized protein n=1 Tax=Acanthochromis polyacanthus TaxID=80966 RepID=A0A3Q1GCB6_9TELE
MADDFDVEAMLEAPYRKVVFFGFCTLMMAFVVPRFRKRRSRSKSRSPGSRKRRSRSKDKKKGKKRSKSRERKRSRSRERHRSRSRSKDRAGRYRARRSPMYVAFKSSIQLVKAV